MKPKLIKMSSRRAELTAKQLITIIILIVSFSIILIFFFMLNFGGEIDKESCRNSVVMRGAFSKIGVGTLNLGGAIKLKCKTETVCISGGGNCEGLTGEFTVLKIEDTESTTEVVKTLVGLQRDCFWMMGEGKIDIGDNVCAICYIIHFDDKLQEKQGISGEYYYRYMQETPGPGESENYINYFYAPFTDWKKFMEEMVKRGEVSKVTPPNFYTPDTYFVYFIWEERGLPPKPEGHAIGIRLYDAEHIANLGCEDFATEL